MIKTQRKPSFLERFSRSAKGTTVVIFAFMAVPIMALSGGAVDYGTALRVKSELSATLDAALLAATQAYALDDSVDTKKIVNEFITRNYTLSGKTLLSSSLTVSDPTISDDGEMTAQLNVKVAANFLKLVGFPEFDFSLSSSAIVGGQSLEVAVVLDNTGSMSGAKLAALKEAATDLVENLIQDGKDTVKMSLVPFADYVNIGVDHRFETGVDVPADFTHSWVVPAGTKCWNTYPDSTQQCSNNPYQGTCYNDGVPYSCQKNSWSCTGDKGDPVQQCQDYPEKVKSNNYSWHGCVASRPHDLNVLDEDYATAVPGLMSTWNWCKQISPITRLTSDKDTITTAIDVMKAKRNTYIPSGLAWGWRTISDRAPFADGVAYSNDAVKKAIILMTDGNNTKSMRKWTGISTSKNAGEVWGHNAGNVADANNMTSELCTNIKAKGIIIHTIAFEVPEGSPVETLMKNCAGNGGKYFDADDSEQLSAAFKQIALALLNLRLSK